MKKIIKTVLIIVIASALFGVGCLALINEKKPETAEVDTPEALEMANKMLKAIHYEEWQKTKIVKWDFKDLRSFVWDKFNNHVQIKWKKNDVRLNLSDLEDYVVFHNQEKVSDTAQAKELKTKAWEYFCNDSFWLNAPAKVFDEGTTRSVVTEDNGEKGLLVSYNSGGATPGDSYLWFLDEEGLPYKYKMWVSIIPVGGTEATWAKWKQLKTGAMVATEHELTVFKILIKNLNAGNTLEEIGQPQDLFNELKVKE